MFYPQKKSINNLSYYDSEFDESGEKHQLFQSIEETQRALTNAGYTNEFDNWNVETAKEFINAATGAAGDTEADRRQLVMEYNIILNRQEPSSDGLQNQSEYYQNKALEIQRVSRLIGNTQDPSKLSQEERDLIGKYGAEVGLASDLLNKVTSAATDWGSAQQNRLR